MIAFGADWTVKVTEAGSDRPVAGAKVTETTLGMERAISRESESDAGGVCRLSFEANGAAIQLDVKKSGWCPLRLEISAQSLPSASPLPFPMKRAGTFGGTIRDETGKPVAGAHLWANFPQKLTGAHIPLDDLYAISDAQGRWAFDFVPAETEMLRITITHPDYSWDGGQPSREQLAGSTAVSLVQSTLALSGRVVGPDGTPVAGATVMRGEQYGIMGLQAGNETTTDQAGKFRFPPQTAGTVQVAAFASGFGPAIKSAQVGRGTVPVELRLSEAHPARLRVTDLEGHEVEGVAVRVDGWGELRYPPWKFQDDGGGRYSFTNAPANELKLDITAPGYMSLIMYSITPGETENVVKLGPALRLHGRVVDAVTKQTVKKFTLTAGWPRQVFLNGALTNSGAEFGMAGRGREFNDGTYDWTFAQPMVVGTQTPYDFILKVEADGYTPALSRTFKATERDAEFDFELKQASFLDAVARLPDGSPVSGATIQLITSANNLNMPARLRARDMPNISTDASGHFRLSEPAQPEVVLVTNETGFAAVTFDQLREVPELKLQRWARVEGTFKLGTEVGAHQTLAAGFPDGGGMSLNPAPEKQLLATGLRRTVFDSREAQTDARGHFIFDCMPPGQIALLRVESIPTPQGGYMIANGGVWGGCRLALLDLKEGDRLQVDLGGKGRAVVGKVASTNRIEDCQATLFPVLPAIPFPAGLSQQQRIEWATVWLASEAGAKVRFWFGNNPAALERMERLRPPTRSGWPVKLAADGSFRILDVPPGDYQFSAAFAAPQTLGSRGATFFGQSSAGPGKAFTVHDGGNLPTLPPLDLGEIGDAKPQVKLFAPEPTRAEPVRVAVQASAGSVAPGAQFDLLVQARILADFHIYGMDPKVSPFIPTSLKLTLPDGLESTGDWTGPSPERDKDGVEIYTGAAVFQRALKARAGAVPKKYSIGVELEYQVCNNEMCYPPKKVELQATVEIAAARQP
jgi:hypothetical protein